MKPLVSICVPTYNRAAFLRASLRDLLAQDYLHLEVLISDNASDDGTEAVCREAAAADARVRYVRQPRNLGLYANHNFCIDESRGEFISFFHDHDERDPQIISAFVQFLQAHPRVGVVSSHWELIDASGNSLGARDHAVPAVTPGLTYIERTIRSGQSSIGIPGVLIRRSALDGIRFDERGHVGFGDFPVWFRLAEQWDVGHLDRRLWRWRQDPGSQSARTILSLTRDYEENLSAYCDGYLRRWPAETQRVARWRHAINRYLFWALAYEVGLYVRTRTGINGSAGGTRTLFEILGYRLTAQEFEHVLQRMRLYQRGMVQPGVLAAITALVRLRFTWPLAWATQHHAALRNLLGLR